MSTMGAMIIMLVIIDHGDYNDGHSDKGHHMIINIMIMAIKTKKMFLM